MLGALIGSAVFLVGAVVGCLVVRSGLRQHGAALSAYETKLDHWKRLAKSDPAVARALAADFGQTERGRAWLNS